MFTCYINTCGYNVVFKFKRSINIDINKNVT